MKESSNLLLKQLSMLVMQLNDHSYSKELPLLMDNSIGKHVRHILDLYDCLLEADASCILNYDNRKRNPILETSSQFALTKIKDIQLGIEKMDLEKELKLHQTIGTTDVEMKSQVQRELLYTIDHTVHHLAIIRIAIQHHFPEISIPENFGFAFSTLRYREKQA